jgi:hypothetical protein
VDQKHPARARVGAGQRRDAGLRHRSLRRCAVAAVENGLCQGGRDITVKLPGGDLLVNYSDGGVVLTGGAAFVFEGAFEY